ncbi:MCE family protein [Nocardioides sp. SYSU D00038]|uniref:MCE family protein n=1 Tax=Nocardioides sp. SYSU D00038 TaxID=2812554 RepID=UPI001968906D|nr:MlaD family protein [Nocardioides sp. SYSU D00038]
MITRRTKVQLLVFVIITLVGCTFVGARYAQLDRIFFDDHYEVTAHFENSGGIFDGGSVTYRGVRVGEVTELELTEDGVDVTLAIDNEWDKIPADSIALVGNQSAVGEQYVELQPQSAKRPYFEDGSEVTQADTEIPIATEVLLENLSDTVGSVDQESLATTVRELGKAFGGTGEDLQRIIDTGNSFIETANDNFELTRSLIRDSNTVLKGQVASTGAIRTFARDLSLFSDVLAGSDKDLRRLIDTGSVAANELRTFLEDNKVDLAQLINNLVTTGEVVVKRLDGVQMILSIYPTVVEGSFSVVTKTPATGLYDAHFGLILTTTAPCHQGYESTRTRAPQYGENTPLNTEARCTEPPSKSNARGAQNAPPRAAPGYQAPVVAAYDPETGELTWGAPEKSLTSAGSVAPASLGEESWKWLFLQPLMSGQE